MSQDRLAGGILYGRSVVAAVVVSMASQIAGLDGRSTCYYVRKRVMEFARGFPMRRLEPPLLADDSYQWIPLKAGDGRRVHAVR